MGRVGMLFLACLLAALQISHVFSSQPITAPAFLWSSHNLGSSSNGAKEMVDYRTLSPKDLAKTVLLEGGWSNVVCSGDNHQQTVDVALVFVGRKLQTSDISKNSNADQHLINLLKVAFTESNFSVAFPYVSVSDATESVENSLLLEFSDTCGQRGRVNDIAFSESCVVEGQDLKRLPGLHAVHEYLGSRRQTKEKGFTDLVVFCSSSQSSEELDQPKSEAEIISELTSLLEETGASYTVLYASHPHTSFEYHSHLALKRFLAEGTSGNESIGSVGCDGLCQLKSTLLEGVFVGIVLLIILLSGLCCMMGIDSPTRFEAPQDS